MNRGKFRFLPMNARGFRFETRLVSMIYFLESSTRWFAPFATGPDSLRAHNERRIIIFVIIALLPPFRKCVIRPCRCCRTNSIKRRRFICFTVRRLVPSSPFSAPHNKTKMTRCPKTRLQMTCEIFTNSQTKSEQTVSMTFKWFTELWNIGICQISQLPFHKTISIQFKVSKFQYDVNNMFFCIRGYKISKIGQFDFGLHRRVSK